MHFRTTRLIPLLFLIGCITEPNGDQGRAEIRVDTSALSALSITRVTVEAAGVSQDQGQTPGANHARDEAGIFPSVISTQSDFRVLRSHARGGLGEVFLAEDGQLRRLVALKVIQKPFDRDPQRRRRFLREAEITSRLEHPGVVPVHGVGTDHDGRPCYTMRFIDGVTLQAAIANFHKPTQPQSAGERNLSLRQLLQSFISVCNTMAFAHSRNVIHRDLKPANIVLGRFGETLVVD